MQGSLQEDLNGPLDCRERKFGGEHEYILWGQSSGQGLFGEGKERPCEKGKENSSKKKNEEEEEKSSADGGPSG